MPQKSKFQTFFEEEAANIPPEELAAMQSCPHIKALLDSLNTSKKKVTAIRSCDRDAITRILGLDTSRVQSLTHQWELPSDVTKVSPSNWLWKGFGFVDDYWQRNSENSTRTVIDLHLLDALNQINKSREENVKPIASWTEISLSWSTETEELSGRGDHFLGYSQGDNVGQALHTLLLAGEAKALNSERNIWQLVAYCGILHKLRKRRAVSNPNSSGSTIYGFITDSHVWEFVRIDNDGLVVTSKAVSDTDEVATWLGYLITVAQASIPSASPGVSLDDLTNFAVKIERFNLRNRRTLEISDDDDDDDTDAAEAFKSAVKKNLEEGKKKARRGSYTEFDV